MTSYNARLYNAIAPVGFDCQLCSVKASNHSGDPPPNIVGNLDIVFPLHALAEGTDHTLYVLGQHTDPARDFSVRCCDDKIMVCDTGLDSVRRLRVLLYL